MSSKMISFAEVQTAIRSRWPDFGDLDVQQTSGILVQLCQIPTGASEITEYQYNLAIQLLDSVHTHQASTLEDAFEQMKKQIVEVPVQAADQAIQALNQKASLLGGHTQHAIQEVDQTELADFKRAYRTLVRGSIAKAILESPPPEISIEDVITGKSASDGDGPGFFTRAALKIIEQQQASPNKALPESPQ